MRELPLAATLCQPQVCVIGVGTLNLKINKLINKKIKNKKLAWLRESHGPTHFTHLVREGKGYILSQRSFSKILVAMKICHFKVTSKFFSFRRGILIKYLFFL